MLAGAATIGIGSTSIIAALGALFIKDDPGALNANAIALIALGSAGVAMGWALLTGFYHHLGHGVLAIGTAMGLLGLILIAGGPLLFGMGLTLGGAATAVLGVGWIRGWDNLHALGLVGLGVAMLVVSVFLMRAGQLTWGFIFIGLAILVPTSGAGRLLGNIDLYHASQVGIGLANAAYGTTLLVAGKPTFGVALLGMAAAGVLYNVNILRHRDLGRRLQLWWRKVTILDMPQ
jgi:hypothetical protein